MRDYGMVVISREGSNPERFIYENDMLTKYSSNITLVTDWFGDDLSSTKIRSVTHFHNQFLYSWRGSEKLYSFQKLTLS